MHLTFDILHISLKREVRELLSSSRRDFTTEAKLFRDIVASCSFSDTGSRHIGGSFSRSVASPKISGSSYGHTSLLTVRKCSTYQQDRTMLVSYSMHCSAAAGVAAGVAMVIISIEQMNVLDG